jgi:hypothetical protein
MTSSPPRRNCSNGRSSANQVARHVEWRSKLLSTRYGGVEQLQQFGLNAVGVSKNVQLN